MQRWHPRGASGTRTSRMSRQRCGVIQTCAGRAVGVGAAAGVNAETCPKEVEQEEWCDACRRRECRRPEGLRLAQAESEGSWLAVGVGTGVERGVGAEAGGAGRGSRVREDKGNQGGQTNLPGWR